MSLRATCLASIEAEVTSEMITFLEESVHALPVISIITISVPHTR